jgi:hypothetical protein
MFSIHSRKNTLISNFMKIHLLEAQLFHVDGRIKRQTDMTKSIAVFRNFANAPKKETGMLMKQPCSLCVRIRAPISTFETCDQFSRKLATDVMPLRTPKPPTSSFSAVSNINMADVRTCEEGGASTESSEAIILKNCVSFVKVLILCNVK